MRRFGLLVALVASIGACVQSGSAAPKPTTAWVDPGPGGFSSANVGYVASIPTGAGVSARVVTVGGQRRLYVSSAHSLTIYDISNPALPIPMGALPIYNWENEDIAVSKDGNTTILTEFESQFYMHVVDTSNPHLPVLKGSVFLDGSHTVECADVHCHYLFASNGKTYDISTGMPHALAEDKWWSTELGVKGSHALHQDAAGVWIADETPWVMFTAKDPVHVKLLDKGQETLNPVYQHNNVRPAAAKWSPRGESAKSSKLRPGEMLMTETESNFNPQCSGADGTGSFSTWSIANFDKGAAPKQLHVLTPVQGDYADGNPAVNALGCSGHWFTVREDMPGRYKGQYLVAAGWYEHGTRFLAVDAKTAQIRQVGYFQPVRGSTSAAYWIPGTNYVYVVDYQRGIDILTFDAKANPPSAAETTQSWLAKLNVVDALSQSERWLCQQAMAKEH